MNRLSRNRPSSEQRNWTLLQKHLDAYPLEKWECFGLLGEIELYPNSPYKLFVRHGEARWWRAEFSLPSRLRVGDDPVRYQKEHGTLPLDRVVQGPLTVLRNLTCDPHKIGLKALLAELQQRLG